MLIRSRAARERLHLLRAAFLSCASLATAASVGGCAPGDSNAPGAARRAQAPALPAAPPDPVQAAAAAIPPALDAYIARAEPSFAWTEETARPNAAETNAAGTAAVAAAGGPPRTARAGGVSRLKVISQEWQGRQWTHNVEIVRPTRDAVPGAAMLVINFGNGSQRESFIAQIAANATGLTIVNAFNVPNQPLWERSEDDLIAYTFAQHLAQDESKDATSEWPLLLPMTKSATQVMRAVEEWSKKAGAPISKWGVSGASKRGWTAWLVAASQAKANPGRVAGLIPMVYDNLNLAAQMPHQKESWGGYSKMIADYSKRGLPDIVSTPRGKTLAGIIDPWTYRERITMPTLIINGSNDSYWPLDAFNLYRGGLIAPTNVFYAPNSGHMLNGNETRVAGITAAWFKQVAQGKVPPQVLASTVDAAGKAVSAQRGEVLASRPGLKWRLQVLAPGGEAIVPRSAKLWAATSATRDFRGARWKSVDLGADREIALDDPRLKSDNPADFHAVFGEVELPGGVGEDADAASPLTIRVPFALSSPVTIWK